MTEWRLEVCGAEMPQELELVSPNTYIQRKNIRFVVPEGWEEEDVETSPHYECLCRFISIAEYNNLKAIEGFRVDEAIDAYTIQLVERGIL